MADITQIDHVTTGLQLLPAMWDDAPVLRGILQSYLEAVNITEAQIIDVRDGFNINTAIGNQLDIIGTLFGVDRLGRSDSEYREAILAVIANISGSGTPDDILNLLDAIENTETSKIWDHYPLSSILSVAADTNLTAPITMQKAFPAAVELQGIIYIEEDVSFIAAEGESALNLLETNLGDTIEVDTGGGTFDLEVETFSESEAFTRISSFVDSSQDAGIGGILAGYGNNYGNNYGGALPPTFVPLADLSDGKNVATGTSSTLVEWAELSETDPTTGTTNKIQPTRQFRDSGLKAKQPLPRQFFNWMVSNISDWLDFLIEQLDVNSVYQTTDATTTAAELDVLLGGTWAAIGTTYSLGTIVTVFRFERTS